MSVELLAGAAVAAASLALVHEPVPADQIVAGSPTTAYVELDETVGVWEMTPGAMSDTEVDEVFIVLRGSATVDFVSPALPQLTLGPGPVGRLDAGMQTVWTVHETLRKVYVAG